MPTLSLSYAASANLSITLASLATSSTLVSGAESAVIDNTSNLYLDALLGGLVTVGTNPTAGTRIEVWCYAPRNDTPDYPDVFDGTASAETVTSVAIKAAALRQAAVMVVDATTSDRGYYFGPVSVANLFGGVLPSRWGVFVTHNTGANLNSTASNHEISYTGIKQASA